MIVKPKIVTSLLVGFVLANMGFMGLSAYASDEFKLGNFKINQCFNDGSYTSQSEEVDDKTFSTCDNEMLTAYQKMMTFPANFDNGKILAKITKKVDSDLYTYFAVGNPKTNEIKMFPYFTVTDVVKNKKETNLYFSKTNNKFCFVLKSNPKDTRVDVWDTAIGAGHYAKSADVLYCSSLTQDGFLDITDTFL